MGPGGVEQFIDRVGPGGGGLGLQRLLMEIGGHLRRHHPPQIVPQGHLLHLIPHQHGQGDALIPQGGLLL